MIAPYWRDERTRLYLGDALAVLAQLPSAQIHCVVTSPPYWGGVRDYGTSGQSGDEPAIGDYISNLVAVFAEVHRVLAGDGTCWLNLGDRYLPAATDGIPRKSLAGVPWRVAIALQDTGWTLRNAVVWNKPNAMPASARDRFTCRYEMIFLLVKQEHYYFNLDPLRVRRPPQAISPASARCSGGRRQRGSQRVQGKYADPRFVSSSRQRHKTPPPTGRRHTAAHRLGRNPGDVWAIPTRPFTRAHFATFPLDLPVRAIAAGCRPGGTVLDPFTGAGTTLVAARKMGRLGIGIDLQAEYLDLTAERIRELDPRSGKGGPQ